MLSYLTTLFRELFNLGKTRKFTPSNRFQHEYNYDFNNAVNLVDIGGFHCHTIIKTIQQIKLRIKEVKEDEYSNSLAKIQVCAIFRAGDIQRNVLLKIIRLCMEEPCLCPSEGHKYGDRKLTKTYVIEFGRKSL